MEKNYMKEIKLIATYLNWAHIVPYENIVNDFKKLCIRLSNLNYVDNEIVYANLRKSANIFIFVSVLDF